MKHYRMVDEGDGTWRVDGVPEDAEKIIEIASLVPRDARRLASLAGHKEDLSFSLNCLRVVEHHRRDTQVAEAAWRSAIFHYGKCFDPHALPLAYRRFLEAGVQREAHSYFISLRNKHFAHDVNPWRTIISAAIISGAGKGHNIDNVIYVVNTGNTLNDANFGNLHLLVEAASRWVDQELDAMFERVKALLEEVDRETLLAQPAPVYTAPTAVQVHQGRTT